MNRGNISSHISSDRMCVCVCFRGSMRLNVTQTHRLSLIDLVFSDLSANQTLYMYYTITSALN